MKTTQVTHILDSTGLVLDYAVLTNPYPLTVGSSATLTLIVSVPLATGTANVTQAGFVFPLGSEPAELCTAAPSGVSVSSNLGKVWTIAASTAGSGNFILTPPNDAPIAMTSETLTIMFTGLTIDTPVGTALLRINEWAAEDSAPAPSTDAPPTGTASIAVAKFPQGFYAGNFAPTVPEVRRNRTATFNWVGTAGTYKIHSGLEPPHDVSNVRTWTSPPLTDAISFLLEANAQGGSQSTFLYFSATVTVVDPSIVANDLQVLTATQTNQLFVGQLRTASPATSASITGGLGTDTIRASGTATIDGPLIASTLAVGGGKINASANGLSLGGSALNAGPISCASIDTLRCWVNWPWAGVPVKVKANTSAPIVVLENDYADQVGIAGIYCQIAIAWSYGFMTNGYIGNSSSSLMFSHVPTRSGHRVITAPAVFEEELHLSGEGRLNGGRATVRFDDETADALHHCANHPYRVQLTPTGRCGVLAVTAKSAESFVVEALGDGDGDAGFDWFVVARRPHEPGGPPRIMPERLPEPQRPTQEPDYDSATEVEKP